MSISTRARTRKADSNTKQELQPLQELDVTVLNNKGGGPSSSSTKELAATLAMAPSESADEGGASNDAVAELSMQQTDEQLQSDGGSTSVSIPAHNIRQFKEAVVNTSRLLKVFSEQEKELTKAKAEISKCHEEARRMQLSCQNLQRESDTRTRELARSNAEMENARSLLVQREKELSRVRGLKEDLEAKILELKHTEPTAEHSAPPRSPNALLMDEIDRLKKELEAKEGSLKSLRISRDSIRSSTKAEIMSIQAKYAREQKELIEKQEREITEHRQSLADKEADLEQEQERLMQLEMDLSMRATQLEDQATELKSNLDEVTGRLEDAREEIKHLEEQAKMRSSEHRSELSRLNRVVKKDEKRIAELEAALERTRAQVKENAKAARESARAKAKHKPKSTATAAEAMSAATEDVAEMDIDELREEVAGLRMDAVHKDETIRKLGVMVEELERKQNPEGRKPRAKVAAMQTEIDELKAELDVRAKKVEALETALHISEGGRSDEGTSADPATTIAQLELKVIALEADLKERDNRITSLEQELKEAQSMANERPMRLRHSSAIRSPSSQSHAQDTLPALSLSALPAQPYTPIYSGSAHRSELVTSSKGRQSMRGTKAREGSNESLYAEVAELRAKLNKLQQEKAALLELITEQQVTIRQLRGGPQLQQALAQAPLSAIASSQSPTQQHRKRSQPKTAAPVLSLTSALPLLDDDADTTTAADEIEEIGLVPAKRPKHNTISGESGLNSPILVSSLNSNISTPSSQAKWAQASAMSTLLRQGDKQTAGEVDLGTIEKLLKDKRISSTNRTKRFFSYMQKAPYALHTALLRMDSVVLSLDAAEFIKAFVPFVTSMSAKPGNSLRILPCDQGSALSAGSSEVSSNLLESTGVALQGLYEGEIASSLSIWIASFKNEQSQFFSGLMQQLAQKIVAPTTRSIAATCSMARIFAALSLLAADIQRVRIMLCDLLMDAVDSPHTLPVLANVLAVWPAALRVPQDKDTTNQQEPQEIADERSAFNLVVRVFQAIAAGIHDLYCEEHSKSEADALYSIMVERCGWRLPSDAEYADKVFVEASNALKNLDQTARTYPVVTCAYNLLAPYVVSG
ncbi:hypothetical protein GGI26_005734 [Coemansia sp. RSA 1358]|nr:hypothetical protein GGI26_005734 [Coemansia sp. RSA 1358]